MATGTAVNARMSDKQMCMLRRLQQHILAGWPQGIAPPTLADVVRAAIHESHCRLVGEEEHRRLMAEEDE